MTIWRMRFACWVTKATDTHSDYLVILVFPRQQWLRERTPVQATLVIRDLTLRVFAITRFRGKKAARKLYSNLAVIVYGGDVTVWRSHQLVTSYQYQCEREC
jgi:hypothetical protein